MSRIPKPRYLFVLSAWIILALGHYLPILLAFFGVALNQREMMACALLRLLSLGMIAGMALSRLGGMLISALPDWFAHPLKSVKADTRLVERIQALDKEADNAVQSRTAQGHHRTMA